MNRLTVNTLLVAHLVFTWGAFVFRVDAFPLTWAPMYSVLETTETVEVPVWDRSLELRATRRDGSVEWLSRSDLNIPTLSFWRLYFERARGRPPNVYFHANAPMESWCYAVRGRTPGGPLLEADWPERILTSINRTLERAVSDDDFIVRIEARATVVRFAHGDPSKYTQQDEIAVLTWDEGANFDAASH